MEIIGTGNNGSGIGYIEDGDYLVFNKTNFGSGASTFKARVAYGGDSSTTIQLRLGSPTGTLIGSLNVESTGGWDDYRELSTTVSGASGEKDCYLCFNGPVNIDSFALELVVILAVIMVAIMAVTMVVTMAVILVAHQELLQIMKLVLMVDTILNIGRTTELEL